jgi:hypothetical protein
MHLLKNAPREEDCFLAFVTVLVDEVLSRNGVRLVDLPDKGSEIKKPADLHNAA